LGKCSEDKEDIMAEEKKDINVVSGVGKSASRSALKLFLIPAGAALVTGLFFGKAIGLVFWLAGSMVVLDIHYGFSKSKRVGRFFYVVCFLAIMYLTFGDVIAKKFYQNFPIMAETMLFSKLGIDIYGTSKIDPTAPKAKAEILVYQKREEEKTANTVVHLLNEGNLDGAIAEVEKQKRSREKINEMISGKKPEDKPAAQVQRQEVEVEWWEDKVPLQAGGKIKIGSVKSGDQLRSLSNNGHVILRDGYNENPIFAGVDMTTTFDDFSGSRELYVSARVDTNIKYKIIRR
jgi:hypothetical protein